MRDEPGPKSRPKPAEVWRPTEVVHVVAQFGEFVREVRTACGIRQADLARRAKVHRQWIGAFEQGKPTLETGLVLRVLETLGYEVTITAYDPIPPWVLRAVAAQKLAKARRATARQARRCRERAYWAKQTKNSRGEGPDVE